MITGGLYSEIRLVYYAPAVAGIKRSRNSSRPSVCLSRQGQLGAQRLGQATRAVRTADPSAHGRRSAEIGGGISSRRAITCLVKAKFHYTGPTGPDWTRPDPHGPARTLSETRTGPREFLGDPGRKNVRTGPVGSGRARVVDLAISPPGLIMA